MNSDTLIRQLQAELERLRAIVDRLPHTADGVPILIHEEPIVFVFTTRKGLYRPGEKTSWWEMEAREIDADGPTVSGYVAGSHMETFLASECYANINKALASERAKS